METESILLPPRARAARSIAEMIEKNAWAPGEALPTEQKLAAHIRVARNTVRAALKDLQENRVIRLEGRRRYVERSRSLSLLSDTVVVMSDGIFPPEGQAFSPGRQPAIFGGLLQSAAHRNAPTLALQSLGDGWEVDRFRQALSGGARGIVVLNQRISDPAGEEAMAAACRAHGCPVAGYLMPASSLYPLVDTVSSDHRGGAYQLTRWLLERGRKRILRYWILNQTPVERPMWLPERDAGYEMAMREAGLEPLPSVFLHTGPCPESELRNRFAESKATAIGQLYQAFKAAGPADALLLSSDGATAVVAAACRELGLVPNRDVWLAGYDNYARDCVELAWEPTLPIITADKHNERIGQLLTETLFRRLAGEFSEAPQHIRVEPELVELSKPEAAG